MGEREEATKKKRGSREFKPREAGGFDSSVPNKMWLLKDVTASYLPTSSWISKASSKREDFIVTGGLGSSSKSFSDAENKT